MIVRHRQDCRFNGEIDADGRPFLTAWHGGAAYIVYDDSPDAPTPSTTRDSRI